MPAARPRDALIVAAVGRRFAQSDATSLANFAWFAARRGEHRAALDAVRAAVALPDPPHTAWRTLERLAAGQTAGILLAASGGDVDGSAPMGDPLAAAVTAHAERDYPAAEACYRAALERPALANAAFNGLGVLHEQRRERAAADAAWQQASSRHVPAVHNAALAMLRRGFPHRARTMLADLVQQASTPAPLHFLAGYAALADQDPAAAMGSLSAALDSDPDLARAQFTLGLACERLGLHAEALTAIRRALLLSPWYLPQVWLLDRGPATPWLELTVDADDTTAAAQTDDVLLSLGRSLLQTGHLGEALAVFDQVLVHQSSQPAALFHRGVVLAKLRRYREALDDWEVVGQSEAAGDLADVSRRHARSARELAALFAAS